MKRILIITAVALGCIFLDAFTAHSQTRRGVVTASSTVITRTRIQKEKKPVKTKWQNNIDATVTQHYDISYTGGWRMGNLFFIGFGTGVHVHPNLIPYDRDALAEAVIDAKDNHTYYSPGRISVPLYAQMRFYFSKRKVAPYLAVSGGLLFQSAVDLNGNDYGEDYDGRYVEGTGYGDVFFGADFRLKNSSSIALSVGIMFYDKTDYLAPNYSDIALAGVRLGYSF